MGKPEHLDPPQKHRLWELCLFGEDPDPMIRHACHTRGDALGLMVKAFATMNGEIYNATIFSHVYGAFEIYYKNFNGGEPINCMWPWFLTRAQAAELYVDLEGNLRGLPRNLDLDRREG